VVSKAGISIADNSIPKIKKEIESASLNPLLEVKNSPTIRGRMKRSTIGSNRSEECMALNPAQKSCESNSLSLDKKLVLVMLRNIIPKTTILQSCYIGGFF